MRRVLGALAELDLGGADLAQGRAELARPRRAGVDPRAQRRVEPRRGLGGRCKRLVQALGAGEDAADEYAT